MIFLDYLRHGPTAIGEAAVKMIIGLFVDSLGDQTKALVGQFTSTSTRPEVGAGFFLGKGGAYQTVASVSCLLLVGTTILGVVAALLSGEPGRALARVMRDLPLAVLAILVFPWFVDQLLTVTDVTADAVLPGDGGVKGIVDIISVPPSRDIAGLMITMMVFLAAVLVFLELVVRNALTMIVTALAPLSFAGMTMPAARPAAGQMVKMTVAIAFAKPAIFIALRIGEDLIAADQDRITPGGWGRYLTGMAVLVVAVFMPFVVWRLIPMVEAYAVSQGVSRAPFRAAMQVAQSAYWAQALAGRGGLGGGPGRFGGRRGRGNGPPPRNGPGRSGPNNPGNPGQPRSLPNPGQPRRGRRRPPPPGPQQPIPAPGGGGPGGSGDGGGIAPNGGQPGRTDVGGRQPGPHARRQPPGGSADQGRVPAGSGPSGVQPGPAGPAGRPGPAGPPGQPAPERRAGPSRPQGAAGSPQQAGSGSGMPPGPPGPSQRVPSAGPSGRSEAGSPPGARGVPRHPAPPGSVNGGRPSRPPQAPAPDGGGVPPGMPPGWRRRPRTPPGGAAAAPPGDRPRA